MIRRMSPLRIFLLGVLLGTWLSYEVAKWFAPAAPPAQTDEGDGRYYGPLTGVYQI